MDMLDEELLKFWAALQRNKVRYIMVGGFATHFHGFNQLIDNKKAVNRPKDQVDVIELEKIKLLRDKP